MGLRDLVILVTGFGCVPLALVDAYYGLLAYCWLTFMRPQSLAWDPRVQAVSIIKWVAVALIIRALTVSGPKVRLRGPTLAFLLLWLWFLLSAIFSIDWSLSQEYLEQFSKMAIAVLLITGLVRSRKQLKWLIVLLAWCPGFYAVKLGLFFARSGGAASTAGQIQGFDNNDLSMFISMGIPMLVFGACEVQNRWGRRLMYLGAAAAVPAVILTTSRGGMLAMIIAAGLTVWLRTNWWKAALAGVVLLGVVLLGNLWVVIPMETRERMETMTTRKTIEEDTSAMGRLKAWRVCRQMARDYPLLGVGLGQHTYMKLYDEYRDVSDPEDIPRAAHSVWFSLMAETGYVGLGIYVLLVAVTLRSCRRVMKLAPPPGVDRKKYWAWNYGAALMVSVISFAVAGTFLSQPRFEYAFALYMATVPLAIIAAEETEERLRPEAIQSGREASQPHSAAVPGTAGRG